MNKPGTQSSDISYAEDIWHMSENSIDESKNMQMRRMKKKDEMLKQRDKNAVENCGWNYIHALSLWQPNLRKLRLRGGKLWCNYAVHFHTYSKNVL